MKKIFFLPLLLLLTSFVFVNQVDAAIEESARRWVCLNTQSTAGHEATLTQDTPAPLPNAETYIFVCINNTCTTGNGARDVEAIGKDGIAALAGIGYNFEGMNPATNPTMSGAGGEIGPIVWQDSTPESHSRIWMALNKFIPTPADVGGAGGQQQGTFTFDIMAKKCLSIAWDPFGRVFDAQTLEPVQGASVTLLWKNAGGSFVPMTAADVVGGGITNPWTTKIDGVFNFVVPPGEYKLQVAGGEVTDIASVHPKYTNAYYDIYPALTDGPDDIIVETEEAEHRDIPIPTRNTNTTAVIIEHTETQGQGIIFSQGRVSHPLAKIVVEIKRKYADGKEEIRDGESFISDKEGNFEVEINQGEFEKTDEYIDMISGLRPEKTNILLTKSGWGILSSILNGWGVEAQTRSNSISIKPMPSFLEGFAYDGFGKVISNALVSIYLIGGTKPYYETKADVKGFYKIGSEYIPPFQYEIKYKTLSGQVITMSTEKYLEQNRAYLVEQKIDLYEYKPESKIVVVTPTKSPNGPDKNGNVPNISNGGTNGVNGTTTKGIVAAITGSGSQGVIMIVVILLILTLIGIGTFVMMKSKQQHPPEL